MILSFKTHWADGKPTFFIDKIWKSIYEEEFKMNTLISKMDYYNKGFEKIGFKLPMEFTIQNISPKLHTIRKGKRWKKGMKIHFAINSRSKDYFQFAPVLTVKSVQKITIYGNPENNFMVMVDGRWLTFEEKEKLSINDGFSEIHDFFKFFSIDRKFEIFSGQIIHWTDLRY